VASVFIVITYDPEHLQVERKQSVNEYWQGSSFFLTCAANIVIGSGKKDEVPQQP
jgi:hypothetical protein